MHENFFSIKKYLFTFGAVELVFFNHLLVGWGDIEDFMANILTNMTKSVFLFKFFELVVLSKNIV